MKISIVTLCPALAVLFSMECYGNNSSVEVNTPASKNVQGLIKNGVYISPEREFSVAIPNWDEKNEYRNMQFKEQLADTGQYLSFGPALLNRNIYRLVFARKLSPESYKIKLESVKEKIFDSYIAQIEKGYNSKAILLSENSNQYKALSSFTRIYKQHTPKKKKTFSKSIPEDFRYHAIDLIDYGSHNVLFWIEIPMHDARENMEVEKALIEGRFTEHKSFVNSFRILKTN